MTELTREQIEGFRDATSRLIAELGPEDIAGKVGFVNALCDMALRSLDKSMGEASAATEPMQQALGESPNLPPTLQECLERISVVIALQNNPDRVGAFSTEMLRSIRSQLEAGKQCAEALGPIAKSAWQDSPKLYRITVRVSTQTINDWQRALTQATATGLLASDGESRG